MRRRAESPEHLQPALLQVNVNAAQLIEALISTGCCWTDATSSFLCSLSQCSESRFLQHIVQTVGETGMQLKIKLSTSHVKSYLRRVLSLLPLTLTQSHSFAPQVADDVNVAMERVCGTLEQESSRLTQTMGETIFELFMSLKILKGFREFLPLKLVISSPLMTHSHSSLNSLFAAGVFV